MSSWIPIEHTEGWFACRDGIPLEENPYANSTEKKRSDWIDGWIGYFNIRDNYNATEAFTINW